MKIKSPPGTVGIREAALLLGYSPMHLQRLCHASKVPHTKRGVCYFFTPEHLKSIYPEVKLPEALKTTPTEVKLPEAL